MPKALIKFIRDIYNTDVFIPLHVPSFHGNELAYVTETIQSTFVSSVGKFVDEFEEKIAKFTNSPRAIATINGTAALHTALYMSGVAAGDLVITQALTFVATCNAIYHMGAQPIFVDISRTTLGLCPIAVSDFLNNFAILEDNVCKLKSTKQRIRAIVPMHTFGHPVALDELKIICENWHLNLVEDAAESLGSFYKGKHTGTIGEFGTLSFNGNKVITTGGGGMVLCKDAKSGIRTKHITTTAKVPHPYAFYHDEPGFNYRLPNLNAALGCAQMERLPQMLAEKRNLAMHYKNYFKNSEYQFVDEPENTQSNFWLNAIICPDTSARDFLLETTNAAGIMTRPVWQLMHRLPMFKNALRGNLDISEWIEKRLVNLPSTPPNSAGP